MVSRATHDYATLDLFEVPSPRQPLPGALHVGPQIRQLLSAMLKASPLSREQVAARMSELTGDTITKHQIDAWTAESREGWRFPLEYAAAFEVSLDSHDLGAWYASLRGGRLSVGREALEAELGKIERQKGDLAKRERALKQLLGGQS
ncbi:MAG: hypothetical protein KDH15_12190 [Rhodocyclaceae bacterium]|nr:hypothetical protein [Rhodocyclaceae bacterium]